MQIPEPPAASPPHAPMPTASTLESAAAIFSGAAPVLPARKPAATAKAAEPGVLDGRPPLVSETANYRVSYGVLGEIAAATISFVPDPGSRGADTSRSVRAVATGSGAVLGFGKTEKHIESEFDTQTLKTTRWTSTRSSGGETVIDIAEQHQPGTVSLVRKRLGQPDQADSMTRASVILDPLGLLLRLRLGPLQVPVSFEILDGRALWVVTISAVRPTAEPVPMLRLEGRTEPIFWDGKPDSERTGRRFTLFLSDDRYRTPLRLIVPFGLGEARAEMVQLSRMGTAQRAWLLRRLLRVTRPCLSKNVPFCSALITAGKGFPSPDLVLATPGT